MKCCGVGRVAILHRNAFETLACALAYLHPAVEPFCISTPSFIIHKFVNFFCCAVGESYLAPKNIRLFTRASSIVDIQSKGRYHAV